MRLHPDFPIVSGEYRLSHDWRLTLPSRFNRRVDRRDLVIWRPGFKIWLALWSWDPGAPPEKRLEAIKSDTSPEAFDVRLEGEAPPIRYSYRLDEERDEGTVKALYAYVLKDGGYLQMAFYVDREDDLAYAESIVESVR
jgi:hypothetical protein